MFHTMFILHSQTVFMNLHEMKLCLSKDTVLAFPSYKSTKDWSNSTTDREQNNLVNSIVYGYLFV